MAAPPRATEARAAELARGSGGDSLEGSRRGDSGRHASSTTTSENWAAELLHAEPAHGSTASTAPPVPMRAAWSLAPSRLGPQHGSSAALAAAPVATAWVPDSTRVPSQGGQQSFATSAVQFARMLSVSRHKAVDDSLPERVSESHRHAPGASLPGLRHLSLRRESKSGSGSPRRLMGEMSPTHSLRRLSTSISSRLSMSSPEAQLRARQALVHERHALIHPASLFMRRWDIVTLVLLAFTATVTPFEVCFLNPDVDLRDGLFWVDRLADLLFAFDVVINFNLAYFDASQARMISGRSQVAWSYARGSAIVDIISTVPFDVIGQLVGRKGSDKLKALRILRIFRLFKLLRVLRSSRVLQRMQDSANVNYGYLTLIKFAATCILIAHWMACLFHLVPTAQTGDCNWINHYYGVLEGNPEAACDPEYGATINIGSKYITSLYWSVMTISTVGYGDVAPQTDAERAFEILGMLLGASTYAYVVGSVCGVAATLSARETEHERAMDLLNRFIGEAHLDGPLSTRLRSYFRFAYTATRHADWAALLSRMSPGLRGETAVAVHGSWMSTVPMLSSCPKGAHVDLAFALLPLVVPPGEALLAINARADQLIAIHKGWAMVAGGGELGIRRIIGPAGVVGHELLWSNRRAAFGAVTLTYVEAHTVSRERLLLVLDAFPQFAYSARTASVAHAFLETMRQVGLAAKRVRALAAEAAADEDRDDPTWGELMEVCMPRDCSVGLESFCQLTTALQVSIVRCVTPSLFRRYNRAAHMVQRVWRARRAARMGFVSDDDEAEAEAVGERAMRSLGKPRTSSWRASELMTNRPAEPPGLSLGTSALGSRNSASPLRRARSSVTSERGGGSGAAANAADVAVAVMAALAPQLQALQAAQASLSQDVARIRFDMARSGMGLPPRAAGSMTDLAAAVGSLRRQGSGSVDGGGSPEERGSSSRARERAPDS